MTISNLTSDVPAEVSAANTPSEHDAAMAKLAQERVTVSGREPTGLATDEATTPTEDKPSRPDNVDPKFWDEDKGVINVEALLQSQRDGQAEITRLNQKKTEGTPDEAEGDDSVAGGDQGDVPEFSPQNVAENLQGFAEEYAENRELSEDTIKKLEDVGIPKGYTETYTQGVEAIQQNHFTKAYMELAGVDVLAKAEQDFNQMVTWAKTNMSEADFDTFNRDFGDPSRMPTAVQGLKSKYQEALGSDGSLVTGDGSASSSSGFKSKHEMQQAISDPRYKIDPVYRREVEAKTHAFYQGS